MPFFIVSLILWAVAFAISQLLAPKPEIENARARGLGDFNFPTATEGRVQPLLWGTVKIKGPNVIWYGDLRTEEITVRVKTSLFNSKTQTTGHRYFVGMQMAIALGEVTLKNIWVGDTLAYTGDVSTPSAIYITGGMTDGPAYFYPGSLTQTRNAYLEGILGTANLPAYRGLSYVVFQQGKIGIDITTPKPWSFEVKRCPNGLGLATSRSELNGGYDANPMNVIYEILTNTEWGYGYPAGDINTTNFTTAAETLYNEGNGFSLHMDRPRKAGDILEELQRQIDGALSINKSTGQWEMTLIRDGYSTTGLKEINEDIAIKIDDFSRGAWEGTTNYIRVQYNNRGNDYADGYAPAQDMANMRIQNRRITGTIQFPGVKDSALANQLAWRELRAASYPLAKARVVVGREFWDTFVGEVVLFSNAEHAIVDMPMRVTKADLGNYEEGEILLDIVQDVFSTYTPSFATPEDSAWAPPVWDLEAIATADQFAFEQPKAFFDRDPYPSEGKIWTTARKTPLRADGYRVLQKNGATLPATGGTYYEASNILSAWAKVGTLNANVDQDDTTIDIDTTELTEDDFATIIAATAGQDMLNLMMIDGEEFICPLSVADITGGIRLTNTYRGFCDSAQKVWPAGTTVWLLPPACLTEVAYPITNYMRMKYIPYWGDEKLSETDPGITELTFQMASRERRPLCPTFMDINTVQYPTTTALEATGSGLDGVGIGVAWLRRDYRTYDQVDSNGIDAQTLDPTFPAANTTQYAVEAVDDPDGTPASLWTTAWNAGTASQTMTRTKILRYTGGVLPTRMQMKVDTQHLHSAVTYAARYTLDHSFDVTSALTGDYNFGVMTTSTWSTLWTAPDTGSYAFTLGTSGTIVTARINGGTENTIITAGSTTGSLTGVTAGDTIEVRHTGTLGVSESMLTVGSPISAEDAYAVFVV